MHGTVNDCSVAPSRTHQDRAGALQLGVRLSDTNRMNKLSLGAKIWLPAVITAGLIAGMAAFTAVRTMRNETTPWNTAVMS